MQRSPSDSASDPRECVGSASDHATRRDVIKSEDHHERRLQNAVPCNIYSCLCRRGGHNKINKPRQRSYTKTYTHNEYLKSLPVLSPTGLSDCRGTADGLRCT